MEDWNVLLLEAGGDGSAVYDIPSFASILLQTKIDWQYTTEPNNSYCLGK
jgi:glucose 1-dehydrogenase (FAD, quinone)